MPSNSDPTVPAAFAAGGRRPASLVRLLRRANNFLPLRRLLWQDAQRGAMVDTRPGKAKIAAYLIGAGLLGPLMALPMAATGRSRGDFLLLAAGCAAALLSGIWLLVRSRSNG